MKVIDGKDEVLGRLATYAVKESLKGEEIRIVNCEKIIITGDKLDIQKKIEEKRAKLGSTQKGPHTSKGSEKFVKQVIRGMLPNYRWGRGKEALKRIKCYVGLPKEFESSKKISVLKDKSKYYGRSKKVTIKEITKW